MHALSNGERFDVHRSITDAIVAAMEAGAGDFVMPWHGDGAAIGKPENARTKMEYHGVNVLALWASAHINGFGTGYWASYRQWQQLGAQVAKGQRGTTIVFYKRIDGADEGEEGSDDGPRLIARASRVFNADQVEGWQPPKPKEGKEPVRQLEEVSRFVQVTGATVFHAMNGGAFYDIRNDTITMPHAIRFSGSDTATEDYYATLLHELVHWSGASHRLDRKLFDVSRSERALEELVAEFGAAFLCADLGVTNAPKPEHAAYIASWLELLRSDARAVFKASRLAHQAAVYLHGFSQEPAA